MEIIYDMKTRDIVYHILDLLDKKLLANQIKNEDEDLNIYINYIKHECKKNKKIQEMVDYFL